ncbi:ester cyclase [Streptomyces sp. JJ38]|uniref:ester cyclase n=1 Tax=Streptomyces sp. JJ38 TaxID=2738128 RepID=UPI001C58A8CC|nr:ester cyclase [Streptomyces sp. JJ38]MBW1596983.1 ester cyclase [Streptomyces sp. JJ38]
MTFVQLIDCKTNRVDDMNRLLDSWVEATRGKRTATHAMVGKDRSSSTHLVEIVEFPSYEEAMRNSNLPETDRIFQEMVALCDEMPQFTDLDVVRDEQLNKGTARQLFEELLNQRDFASLEEYFHEDYTEHDPANPEGVVHGLQQLRQNLNREIVPFEPRFTVDSAAADGDLVCVRFTATGRHVGEFMGLAPTGKEFSLTGQVTFRFRDGKIAEGWFNWDNARLLAELGLVEMPG